MREGPAVRILWRFTQLLLAAPLLYSAAAFAVFDFARIAGARTSGERFVAYGPRPRPTFCRSDYSPREEDDFSGREWPFRLFRPVCRLWLRSNPEP